MRRAALFLAFVVISGCAGQGDLVNSSNSAELSFSRAAAPGGLPGKFDSVDGKRLEGSFLTIRVAQGTHTIGYSCPDVISVDSQTVVAASFLAGRHYVLDCSANMAGAIREK